MVKALDYVNQDLTIILIFLRFPQIASMPRQQEAVYKKKHPHSQKIKCVCLSLFGGGWLQVVIGHGQDKN